MTCWYWPPGEVGRPTLVSGLTLRLGGGHTHTNTHWSHLALQGCLGPLLSKRNGRFVRRGVGQSLLLHRSLPPPLSDQLPRPPGDVERLRARKARDAQRTQVSSMTPLSVAAHACQTNAGSVPPSGKGWPSPGQALELAAIEAARSFAGCQPRSCSSSTTRSGRSRSHRMSLRRGVGPCSWRKRRLFLRRRVVQGKTCERPRCHLAASRVGGARVCVGGGGGERLLKMLSATPVSRKSPPKDPNMNNQCSREPVLSDCCQGRPTFCRILSSFVNVSTSFGQFFQNLTKFDPTWLMFGRSLLPRHEHHSNNDILK